MLDSELTGHGVANAIGVRSTGDEDDLRHPAEVYDRVKWIEVLCFPGSGNWRLKIGGRVVLRVHILIPDAEGPLRKL